MRFTLLERVTIEKSLIYVLIFGVLITFGFVFYLFFSHLARGIEITAPKGGEEWQIGQTYQISWKEKGVDKVGIVLFKGQEPKWIAKDIYAKLGKYEWKIYAGQEYGDDYWIAVFEYPWKKGNKIAYSDGALAVVYPELASCDMLSIEKKGIYIPSDLPDIRRVLITTESYSGDLGGLDGADQKCQQEAERQGFSGNWNAFLGGDADQELAVEKSRGTPRGIDGIFVEAKPAAALIRGATCHQLLGGNFDEFLERLSALSIINEEELEGSFFDNLGNIWLGRMDGRSKKNCIGIAAFLPDPHRLLAEKYSFTTTCQNWTKGEMMVEGYPVPMGEPKPEFPTCYTPEGIFTDAVILGGLASGLTGTGINRTFTPYQGKDCSNPQKLLCIEE